MASDLGGHSIGSAPKRIKLDIFHDLSSKSDDLDDVSFSASFSIPDHAETHDSDFELKRKIRDLDNDLLEQTTSTDSKLAQDEELNVEDDEVSSTISNLSNVSRLSDISGRSWKPNQESISWVHKQMLNGENPREVLSHLTGSSSSSEVENEDIDDRTLWKVIINMLNEPPRRCRLSNVKTLHDVVHLLKTRSRVIVLTGAGVSVSCGIPDFRSRDGVYSRLAVDFPDLPDPQAMFDINYFRQDPRPFFKFAREIFPGQFKPSPCHRFIKMIETQKKLLRNYTQNIDTLEQVAGINNVIECHGSFATATCTICGHKVTADEIREDIFQQKIPQCPLHLLNPENTCQGVMKPDIVFFGESLPESFHTSIASDKDICDLLIVIGSSLKVRPVALIPSSIPPDVPQILINRERLGHLVFDVELFGDSDVIVDQICRMMGDSWTDVCWLDQPLNETPYLLPAPSRSVAEESDMLEDRNEAMDHEAIQNIVADICESANGEGMAIENDENKSIVAQRHMSHDSTQDSGIGDGTDSSHSAENNMSVENEPTTQDSGIGDSSNSSHGAVAIENEPTTLDSGIGDGSHSPEPTIGLAQRLPEHTYFYLQPRSYVFPGAEVINDSDNEEEDDTSSDDNISEVESDVPIRSWSL